MIDPDDDDLPGPDGCDNSSSVMDQIDWSRKSLNSIQLNEVKQCVSEWAGIFSSSNTDIGLSCMVRHHIYMYIDRPFKQRYRHIPRSLYHEVKKHLQDLLDANVFRPSHSPWCSVMVLVRKQRDSHITGLS